MNDTVVPPAEAIKRVSEALSEAMEKLFKLGGFALVALFVGSMVMAAAVALNLTMVMFWAGFALDLGALVAVAYAAEQKRRDLRSGLQENSAMADALQDMALRATEATLRLQTLLLVNAHSVADTLVAASPVLKLFGAERLASETDLQANVVKFLDSAGEIVKKAQKAISISDPQPLLEYAEDLRQLNARVSDALKAPRANVESLRSELVRNVTSLQEKVGEFCVCVADVTVRSQGVVSAVTAAGRIPLLRAGLERAGLGRPLQEAERLELVLEATAKANDALSKAVRGGGSAEFSAALAAVSQLRSLLQSSSGLVLGAP